MKDLINVADFERRARKKLPKFIFDFISGGAEDESTVAANRAGFQRICFRPRVLVDVSNVDLSTTIFGERVSMPLLLAPTGGARMASRHGEPDIVRAAGREGIVFVLSPASTSTIEELASLATAPLWFQLYPIGGRHKMEPQVRRAQSAGYRVLFVTVDVPVVGKRERDMRNQMTLPVRLSRNKVMDAAMHPRWLLDFLLGPPMRSQLTDKSAGRRNRLVSLLPQVDKAYVDPNTTWDDLAWLRDLWKGPLVVKGIMNPDDALRAIELGADGISVSNHGGRQLDGLPSAIDVLPQIVAAVNGRAEVFLDGGIRRGSDIVKAISLGAKACLIGRPYWFGLAVGGEEGVARVLQILRAEMERAMMLLGRASVGELDRSVVWMRGELAKDHSVDYTLEGVPL